MDGEVEQRVAPPTLATIEAFPAAAKSLQLCLTLCDTIDNSPPGSPVPGILQARTLEWVAISFSGLSLETGIIVGFYLFLIVYLSLL